jgi:ABC-2 type transport system permease protein
MEILYILWLRQLKRYIRNRSRIIGSLGQPLLFLVALGFGFGPIYQKASHGANYMQFITPGIIAMSILFTSIFSGVEIIWDRQFGFLKETLVAPVSRIQIMIGRTLGGATVAMIQGLIVLALSFFLGFRIADIPLFPVSIVAMFLVAILFTSIGTAIGSTLSDMQGFQLIMNFLVMPLFFLSGALFPLQGLPTFLTIITFSDPLTYGVDALRWTLSLSGHLSLSLDMFVLVVLSSIVISIGAYLFSKVEV